MWPPLISGGNLDCVTRDIAARLHASMWPPLISGGNRRRHGNEGPCNVRFNVAAADQRRKSALARPIAAVLDWLQCGRR